MAPVHDVTLDDPEGTEDTTNYAGQVSQSRVALLQQRISELEDILTRFRQLVQSFLLRGWDEPEPPTWQEAYERLSHFFAHENVDLDHLERLANDMQGFVRREREAREVHHATPAAQQARREAAEPPELPERPNNVARALMEPVDPDED